MVTTVPLAVDVEDLRGKVREMYQRVAREPQAGFHFEVGRALAERLGYELSELERIPPDAIDSFAGVGYYFDLAELRQGEVVLDLGSGSGMDTFLAALRVGEEGRVLGVDMTEAQLEKAEALRTASAIRNVSFRKGFLEALPVEDDSVDCVISNGVINLCPDKAQVFREIRRVLRPRGRVALADIVTDKELPDNVTCDASLWAACIGGAAQQERYRAWIEEAGFRVSRVKQNPQYEFLSRPAVRASGEYGVKSISVLAIREGSTR